MPRGGPEALAAGWSKALGQILAECERGNFDASWVATGLPRHLTEFRQDLADIATGVHEGLGGALDQRGRGRVADESHHQLPGDEMRRGRVRRQDVEHHIPVLDSAASRDAAPVNDRASGRLADGWIAAGVAAAAAAMYAVTFHPDWIYDPLRYAELVHADRARLEQARAENNMSLNDKEACAGKRLPPAAEFRC